MMSMGTVVSARCWCGGCEESIWPGLKRGFKGVGEGIGVRMASVECIYADVSNR